MSCAVISGPYLRWSESILAMYSSEEGVVRSPGMYQPPVGRNLILSSATPCEKPVQTPSLQVLVPSLWHETHSVSTQANNPS